MKVVIIGATGAIGTEVAKALAREHEILSVGLHSGDLQVDITSKESLEQLFLEIGSCDAIVCTVGDARYGRLEELTDDDYLFGWTNKVMGQANVVRTGLPYLTEGGSFTLTSGVLSQEPRPGTIAISMANAAVEAFVRTAALEMPRGIRINAVSPVWATETLQALHLDIPGGMPAAEFVPAYRESLEGRRTGAVLDVREFAPSLSASSFGTS